ncbi:MAG TPA: dihydroorotate dehydrogenase catalytic subunit, partial [Thermomicrobiales bacterium]|nr:dihydroorotate dehydrogenase catalytic subunit [Thermomicrobiales bacterium]
IATAVEDAGADAISLINTLVGMAIDPRTRRSKLANLTGGLSGPAVKPVAVRMVYQAASVVKIPVIGLGGISGLQDALEFFMAGASAIQLGTAVFSTPSVLISLIDEIGEWLDRNGCDALGDIVGAANPNFGGRR